jgi:hypothetical protein
VSAAHSTCDRAQLEVGSACRRYASTTSCYDPSLSGDGYTFPSYLFDVMALRVPDFFRSRAEGFGDKRKGLNDRVVPFADPFTITRLAAPIACGWELREVAIAAGVTHARAKRLLDDLQDELAEGVTLESLERWTRPASGGRPRKQAA